MFITIINDCRDENASGRQCARVASLFSIAPSFIGVENDLQASGNIIDVLDATEGKKGVILANVAPRNGAGKKFKNGTPFGFFYWKDTLVISSIAGNTLCLIKKLGIADAIQVMDIPQVLDSVAETKALDKSARHRIIWSQFRSFDFLPRLGRWLMDGIAVPTKEYILPDNVVEPRVWAVDCFGNIKTTLLKEDIALGADGRVNTRFGLLKFYAHLRDVPDGFAGITVGSSGIDDKRFLEIVMQGKSAANEFGVGVGDGVI